MAANAHVLINVESAKTEEVVDRLNNQRGGGSRGAGTLRRGGGTGGGHGGGPHRVLAPPNPPHFGRDQRGHLLVVHQHLKRAGR